MNGNNLLHRSAFLIAALGINLLIFIGIPQISTHKIQKISKKVFNPVFLSRYEPSPSSPPKKIILPQNMPKNVPPPKNMPKMQIKPKKMSVRPPKIPQINIPKIQLKINPLIKTGMTISAPLVPPSPKIQPKIKAVQKAAASAIKSDTQNTVTNSSKSVTKQASSLSSVPSEFEVNQVDQSPKILRKIEPIYPYRARRRNIKGQVRVRFLVTANGRVEKASIVKASPKGIFEDNVLKAVYRWKFKPGYYQGKPVATWVVLPIQFDLDR